MGIVEDGPKVEQCKVMAYLQKVRLVVGKE